MTIYRCTLPVVNRIVRKTGREDSGESNDSSSLQFELYADVFKLGLRILKLDFCKVSLHDKHIPMLRIGRDLPEKYPALVPVKCRYGFKIGNYSIMFCTWKKWCRG